MTSTSQGADNIAAALAQLADSGAAPGPRRYRAREVAVVLVTFAVSLVAFDSQALVTWAQRMDVGPVQGAWLRVLGPEHELMQAAHLTIPRELLGAAGDRLGRSLGAGEDPLLSGGWSNAPDAADLEPAEPPAVAADAPSDDDLLEPLPEGAAVPEPGTPPEPAPRAKVVTVLLVGDSLIAGSLGATIQRALARDKRLKVVTAFQTATGLARPEVFDWMKVLPPLLEREKPKLIVCSFGANDTTNIRTADRQLDFGETAWRQAYAERVMAMMQAFSQTEARVLWLGLPPMRENRYSEHTQVLNRIFEQSARKVPQVEFLELGMLVSTGEREYATFRRGPDGRLVRYRLDDGVHYAPAGAQAVGRWVVDWLYERFRRLPRH